MATMIWMQTIVKTYRLGEVSVPVLKRIDLAIEQGEWQPEGWILAKVSLRSCVKSHVLRTVRMIDFMGFGSFEDVPCSSPHRMMNLIGWRWTPSRIVFMDWSA